MGTELTREQKVAVRVCDEWLQEVGLPLYSDLAKKTEEPVAPAELESKFPPVELVGVA